MEKCSISFGLSYNGSIRAFGAQGNCSIQLRPAFKNGGFSLQKTIYEACERKQKGESNLSWQELADLFDIPSGKILKDRFYRAKNKNKYNENADGYVPEKEEDDPTYKETVEIKNDGSQVSDKLLWMFEHESKSKEFVLNAHGYDPEQWDLVNAISNMWHGMRPKDMGLKTLFQSKITVKPKVESGLTLSAIDKYFEELVPQRLSKFSEPRQYKLGSLVLEAILADIHVANESLPHEELIERVKHVVFEIKRRTLGLQLEEIILVQLGDVFHFDNYNRQTTSGTQVTSTGNYQQMFDKGVDLMIWVLDELSSITKVRMINIFGNHDKVTSYALAKTLEAYYKNNENIIVDTTHDVVKFLEIGINSVALVHGDMPKQNLYNVFTTDENGRELFGRTKYSETHIGHLHHEISIDKNGVVSRWIPSITIPDEWHKANGYRGAKQGTQCFLWDKENGLESTWIINCK